MAIRSAKDNITKNDIIDILKQNVTLYKNEPVFVEYIVNLALYLIDQACAGQENQDRIIEELITSQEKIQSSLGDQTTGAPSGSHDLEDFSSYEDDEPSTNKLRLQQYDAVFKHPPTPGLDTEDQQQTPAPETFPVKTSQRDPEKSDLDSLDIDSEDSSAEDIVSQEEPDFDLPKAKQLRSVGILTPEPQDGDLEKGPKILIDQTGRTRVYKVVRSYKTQREEDGNCPICGTYAGSEHRCPSCGHIL